MNDSVTATVDTSTPGSRKTSAPLTSASPGLGEIAKLALVCVQLALVLAVIYQFQLESRTFFNVMALGFAGFVAHALLPSRYRLPFFAGLSLAGILLACGLVDGGSIILLGIVLIGICRLPLRLSLRVSLLVVVAALFGLWRLEKLPGPWSVAIWPILGSMFMFRLALYLHALKHEKTRPTIASTLAYFFMLPNVCFPLFPVVDYSTFRRQYYDREPHAIYQEGVTWIVRGLVQLILYRFVYLHLAGDSLDVRSLGDLVQFLLSTILLYLRISGQFHLIAGFLHLFGFRVPETHHLYFLAFSFTDFWRRINIYWKDFMMKLIYYPSFFKLRRYGSDTALVGATAIVFLATWFLHSYQWFWLRGGFPLAPQDGLFWAVLGILVVAGARKEMRRSRPRRLGKAPPWSFSLAASTVGTFWVICVLWSLWSAETIPQWLLLWGAAGKVSATELVGIGVLFVVSLAIAGTDWSAVQARRKLTPSRARQWGGHAVLPLIGLLALGWTDLYAPIAPVVASTVVSVQQSTLNARDKSLQHKGYYENLDNASRLSAQLWDVTDEKPATWIPIADTGVYRFRRDFIGAELIPNKHILFKDYPFTTNSWGMRDRDRTLEKPPGVYRIAMLGPSHVMGSGVSDEKTIARQLEEALNRSESGGRTYEVLNFGVAAYAISQQLAILEENVLRFDPDAVFFVDSPRMATPIVSHLLTAVGSGTAIPFARLRNVVEETGVASMGGDGVPVLFDAGRAIAAGFGVKARMPLVEAEKRLYEAGDRLVEATLEEAAEIARNRHVVPVFVGLDNVVDPPEEPVPALRQAAEARMVVFDLYDLWAGLDPSALRIASWDNHPNEEANRLIAERLRQLIREHAAELGLEFPYGQ